MDIFKNKGLNDFRLLYFETKYILHILKIKTTILPYTNIVNSAINSTSISVFTNKFEVNIKPNIIFEKLRG
jgi:hypothetical protein